MESPRQVWCAVFTGLGVVILIVHAAGFLSDPAPFLTFFTGIGLPYIVGASAGDVMKSYRVSSYSPDDLETGPSYRVDPKDVDDDSIL